MPTKKLHAILLLSFIAMGIFVSPSSAEVSEVSSVGNYDITWSNPSVPFNEPTPAPALREVSHSEWNQIFADWKSGEVSREETAQILKGVKRA